MGMIINPYNFKVPLLLDTYTGAAAAYSLRKLRTAYTGYCIEVRRSSDDTTENIGFVNGVLDESALTTFVGAGDGFVKTWYDQTANGKNLVQATSANQPQIVSSGTVITEGSKPIVQWADNVNLKCNFSSSISQPFTVIAVVDKTNPVQAYNAIFDGYGSSNRAWLTTYSLSPKDRITLYCGSDVLTGYSYDADKNLFFAVFNTSTSKLYVNGTGYNEINVGTGAFIPLTLGAVQNNTTYWWYGDIAEFIIYPANKTTDRTAIETNINSFYSMY